MPISGVEWDDPISPHMNLSETASSIAPWSPAVAPKTIFDVSLSSRSNPALARLPGYFIDREGNVERGADIVRGGEEMTGIHSDFGGMANANKLSEEEALHRLQRVLSETGQLVVRAADGSSTAWFAGIGDPSDLFFELRPREAWTDRDELVMGAICSLAEAERVLRLIYRGGEEEIGFFMPISASRSDREDAVEL